MKKDNVHALSNNQLQTIGAILRDEAGLKTIIAHAQAGSPVDVATFNDVADYVASRRAAWQRAVIMSLLSLTDVQVIVNVLLGKAQLKRRTYTNKMVSGKQEGVGLDFFVPEDAKVLGVKSMPNDAIPENFFPTSLMLLSSAYTPVTTDGVTMHLHQLTDLKQYEVIRGATYVLVSNAAILNADLTLKINGVAYLEEEAIRPLGDAYRTDAIRGSLEIDTVKIAPKATPIVARIVMANTKVPADMILSLAISGVAIV